MSITNTLSRRKFLHNTAVTTGLAVSVVAAPYVITQPITTLRVMGTHVTLQEPLRQRAMLDLGINLEFEPHGEAELVQRATTRPDQFDVYEQWSNSIRTLWQAQAIQPIDISRLTYWDEINDISKKGRINPQAPIGLGDVPYKILNIQADGSLGTKMTGQVSFLPYVHNVDSFGYNSNIVPKGVPYKTESWSWLLDERWKGKVGLVNSPTIGIFDLALAVQAKKLMTFADMGNMTIEEIDKLFDIIIGLKKQGHFSGFWNTVPQSVDQMTSGKTLIGSLFSPAVSAANGQGTPVIYAAPKEGYRAWHGVMCLSKACRGPTLDAAYKYTNWWPSGWPGAFIARQGYYISNPERSRSFLSPAEWAYWYDGQAASEPLRGTDGVISVPTGDLRTGGSYTKRFSNVAIWNTVMDNYDYTLQRWNELLLA